MAYTLVDNVCVCVCICVCVCVCVFVCVCVLKSWKCTVSHYNPQQGNSQLCLFHC